MQLFYPIGLLALAGIIIPVLIHLWQVKKGKTLKIGSIALLGESANSNAKSLKINDWLLFILRCLLIILLAIFLAQPFFFKEKKTAEKKAWMLIEKNSFPEAYNSSRQTIDSLLSLGFELRDFNFGFEPYNIKDSASFSNAPSSLSYTSLLNALNTELPSGYSVYLFADRRLAHFDGPIPKLSYNLIWNEVRHGDSLKTWTTNYLGKDYKAESTVNSTRYSANSKEPVSERNIAIYDPQQRDAKYLKAAIRAISDFSGRKINVTDWTNNETKGYDLVFWLSDRPIQANSKVMFSYMPGKPTSINSTLQFSGNYDTDIKLKKRIAANLTDDDVLWKDSYGDPILSVDDKEKTKQYSFYTRFNPQWTDLVWDEEMVNALIPIVLGTDEMGFGFEKHDADQRLMPENPLRSANLSHREEIVAKAPESLSFSLWLAAFLVLVLERVLSFKQKSKSNKW